ncbi:AcrR family transcriptional regulator [Sphingobium xanthum]|jgi:TetR/AcrR family transcriptional repressor of nem operon|uniref:TetR/AcrR family transcriptional regulator n=1 Tax=Sphingobium xanthum TaxID=1387165 RepID=UPI001C8BB480|nr:TetR/AcrR family transcriptional regulator [Sphingobium xanthum]
MAEIRSPSSVRSRIVEVADRLFYERGFEATSFADIATDTGLSRGNFYYHFKSKDEILAAVISLRMARTREMLTVWESETPEPADRMLAFANILITNRAKIMAHGCPVGTLCAELAKLEHGAQDEAATIFTLFRDWLTRQFVALGRADNADALAMHVLMRSQGIASLATAFRDEAFIAREVDALAAWLSHPKL